MGFRRVMCAVTLVAYLAACGGWQPVTEVQPETLQGSQTIRVTTRDGRSIELQDARVSGDSIRGTLVVPNGWQATRREPLSFPLSGIERAEIQKSNGAALIVLSVVGGLAILTVVAARAAAPEYLRFYGCVVWRLDCPRN